MTGPHQGVGGAPGREHCRYRHSRNDLADPLTGRRPPGDRMPPGIGLGRVVELGVGARPPAVMAAPLEQAGLTAAALGA
jgi:hypothetical protein